MAWYKNREYIKESSSGAFDDIHDPGEAAPYAGIYRCMGCHREVGIAEGHTLPAQSHPQHTSSQGKIRWRLVVYADHDPKN